MSAAQIWPGFGSGVDLGYSVAVHPGSPYVSVPDGRCGLVLAKRRLWWLGPSSRPWRANPEVGRVVGLLRLSAGRPVAGGSLDQWRDRRVPLEAVWDEIAARLAVRPRQVPRRCVADFGLPPTTLRRIMRLHRAARWRAVHPVSTLAAVATSIGFGDQAHLARECRALAAADARSAPG